MTTTSNITSIANLAPRALPAMPTTDPATTTTRSAVSQTLYLGGPRKAVKDMDANERFSTLETRFNKKASKGVDVRFQFELSGKGGGTWYVEIKDGKLTVKKGKGPNPTATLRASASDYIKIANGEMNKMMAFIRGKLKVDGDKDELKKFDSYFNN